MGLKTTLNHGIIRKLECKPLRHSRRLSLLRSRSTAPGFLYGTPAGYIGTKRLAKISVSHLATVIGISSCSDFWLELLSSDLKSSYQEMLLSRVTYEKCTRHGAQCSMCANKLLPECTFRRPPDIHLEANHYPDTTGHLVGKQAVLPP